MNTVLVVAPDQGIHFKAFVLEYLSSVPTSVKVLYLDLSDLAPTFYGKRFKNFLRRKVFYKNTIDEIIDKTCKQLNIEVLKIATGASISDINSETDLLFLEPNNQKILSWTLDSTHSYLSGGNYNQEGMIPLELIELEKRIFKLVFQIVSKTIRDFKVKSLVTVNGRHLIDSAALLAAELIGIDRNLLETGSGRTYGWRVYRTSPHNYREWSEKTAIEWESSGKNVREALIGLAHRLTGDMGNGKSWIYKFDYKKTRSWIQKEFEGKKFVVFYTNTRFELPVRSQSKTPTSFGGSQELAFISLARVAKEHGYNVVVRMHPSGGFAQIAKAESDVWREICVEEGAISVDSEQDIDSIALMQESSLNVFYASFAAAESIALSCPTMILGNNTELAEFFPHNLSLTKQEIENRFNSNFVTTPPSASYPLFRAWGFGGEPFKALSVTENGKFFDLSGKQINQLRFPFDIVKKFTGLRLYPKFVSTGSIDWN